MMLIDPKRAMEDFRKMQEKYQAYLEICKREDRTPLTFEQFQKAYSDWVWEEGLKQAGMIIVDLGSTKIVTWPPKKKEAENKQVGDSQR
jgi:hypothetical protein